jgi:phospholipid-translocating ATPase
MVSSIHCLVDMVCSLSSSKADPPIKDIHAFYGVLTLTSTAPGPQTSSSVPLSVENILWANTVLAAGSAVGLVVYTGKETRAVLNTSEPETKMGTLEWEVNKMAKVRAIDPSGDVRSS